MTNDKMAAGNAVISLVKRNEVPIERICHHEPIPAATRPRHGSQLRRPVRITRGFTVHAEGSVLIEFGATKVLCTASVEEKVPPHKRGSGEGAG